MGQQDYVLKKVNLDVFNPVNPSQTAVAPERAVGMISNNGCSTEADPGTPGYVS